MAAGSEIRDQALAVLHEPAATSWLGLVRDFPHSKAYHQDFVYLPPPSSSFSSSVKTPLQKVQVAQRRFLPRGRRFRQQRPLQALLPCSPSPPVFCPGRRRPHRRQLPHFLVLAAGCWLLLETSPAAADVFVLFFAEAIPNYCSMSQSNCDWPISKL